MKNFHRRSTVSAAILLMFTYGAFAQTSSLSQVKSIISQHIKAHDFIGIEVGYIAPNGDVSFISDGVLNSKTGKPVNKNSIFEIGSISKVFTSLALAEILEKKGIDLNTSAEKLLPAGYKLPEYKGEKITVRQLVTHTSGLPRMPSNFPSGLSNPYARYTAKELKSFLSSYKLTRAPGTKFQYSNLGMALAGLILENETGESYGRSIKELITNPLHMNSTMINIPRDDSARFATAYRYGSEVSHWDLNIFDGAGGLRSSCADLVRFLKAEMGLYKSKLYPSMKKTQVSLYNIKNHGKQLDGIGMSWLYSTSRDTVIWHDGETGGFISFLGFNAQNGSGVVVLSNSVFPVSDLAFHLLDAGYPLNKVQKSIPITAKQLSRYTGEYKVTDTISYYVTRQGNQLFFRVTGQEKIPFYPQSKAVFFCKIIPVQIKFSVGEDSSAQKVTLFQNGRTIVAYKVRKKVKGD